MYSVCREHWIMFSVIPETLWTQYVNMDDFKAFPLVLLLFKKRTLIIPQESSQ